MLGGQLSPPDPIASGGDRALAFVHATVFTEVRISVLGPVVLEVLGQTSPLVGCVPAKSDGRTDGDGPTLLWILGRLVSGASEVLAEGLDALFDGGLGIVGLTAGRSHMGHKVIPVFRLVRFPRLEELGGREARLLGLLRRARRSLHRRWDVWGFGRWQVSH